MKTLTAIKMTIMAVLITLGSISAQARGLELTNAGENLVGIADQTIQLVNEQKAFANYRELGMYILPIRKAAVNLKVMGTMHFPSERKAIAAIWKLIKTIDSASRYIDEQLETDSGNELATELMTINEQLKNFVR